MFTSKRAEKDSVTNKKHTNRQKSCKSTKRYKMLTLNLLLDFFYRLAYSNCY